MKYWVINTPLLSDGVRLSRLSSKMPKSYKFNKGISLVDEYPPVENCDIYYDPSFPENNVLYDFVSNVSAVMIVNPKVKAVYDSLGVNNIEYLPIWLYDHKDEVSSKDYMICNVLGKVDIIDMKKSDYVMSSLDEDQIDDIDELVVDNKAIPDDAKVFRASKMLNQIFISDEVKKALEAAGIEGYSVVEAEGWDGL